MPESHVKWSLAAHNERGNIESLMELLYNGV